jgi:hypothetical protein
MGSVVVLRHLQEEVGQWEREERDHLRGRVMRTVTKMRMAVTRVAARNAVVVTLRFTGWFGQA